MLNLSLLSISDMFHGAQNNFGPLNHHIINEILWVITMVTGHAQHGHLVVTRFVSVATAEKIVITF